MSDIITSVLVQGLVLAPPAVMLAVVLWRRRCGEMYKSKEQRYER